MPFNIGGKGSGGGSGNGKGLPRGYAYKLGEDGELELWKGTEKVSIQSPDGSWFTDSISTGVGSLHLGGNESGGMAHSISSTGQNVGFKNEYSQLADKDKLFFFPVWQGCSTDGVTLINPAMLSFGSLNTNTLPNGIIHLNATCLYDFNLVATANSVTYSVEVIANEQYIGGIRNVIISNVTNAEIYNTSQQVAVTSGSPLKISYKYPLFVRTGDNLQLRLIKDDGTYLRCRSGDANIALPYRKLSARSFSDIEVAAANGYGSSRVLTTDTNGKIAASSAITGSRVLVSNTSGLPVASNVSSTEIESINGNATIDNAITIADTDGFVVNDDKVMKQTTAARVWAYISGKLTGAISGVLTSNLTASRNVITDSNGKLAVASYSASKNLVTDSNGYITTGNSVFDEVVYKNSVNSAGTYYAISNALGGYSVYFTHTGTQIGIGVTNTTTTMARYAYTFTSSGGTAVNGWTSSSSSLPVELTKIAYNGSSQIGTLCVSNGTSMINIHWSIITNGSATALLYARIT